MAKEQTPLDPEFWEGVDTIAPGIGEVVKFQNIGDVLVGTYLGRTEVETDDGMVGAHTFVDPNGEPIAAWASYDLDKKLAEVQTESLVRIEYVKDIETSRGQTPMKSFRVQAKFS